MKRNGERTPRPSAPSANPRAAPAKPARGAEVVETFGRFVRNLARLEAAAPRLGKGRGAGR